MSSSERAARSPAPGEPSDWVARLDADVADVLRRLPWSRLARVPPPKRGGLPVGHELRILRRALAGGSSSLDPSGLARIHAAFLSPPAARCWRGLVLNEPLDEPSWRSLLGPAHARWRDAGLLRATDRGLVAAFRAIPVEDLLLLADPEGPSFRDKVHIGQDSLHLLEFVRARWSRTPRLLDVGTGSGILLAALASDVEEAVGIDINPRAVAVAGFNAALNGRTACRVEERDVLGSLDGLGRFDRVVWNAPFMFYPEEERANAVDAAGGDLGIALTLDFLERLPDLLAESGRAWIMSASPVLGSGESRLETGLRERVSRLGLDVRVDVLQSFWVPRLRAFHARHDIRRFESVILSCARGAGVVDRVPPLLARRALDGLREALMRFRAS